MSLIDPKNLSKQKFIRKEVGMNIKNLTGTSQILSGVNSKDSAKPVEKSIKADESHDRDANGQALFQRQVKKEKMTHEQAEKAVHLLNEKPFMKDMSWVATLVEENTYFFAEVKNLTGELIRRISESGLWEILDQVSSDPHKGNLLKRVA